MDANGLRLLRLMPPLLRLDLCLVLCLDLCLDLVLCLLHLLRVPHFLQPLFISVQYAEKYSLRQL